MQVLILVILNSHWGLGAADGKGNRRDQGFAERWKSLEAPIVLETLELLESKEFVKNHYILDYI